MRGYACFQQLRINGLELAHLFGTPEPYRIDCDQHIGRAGRPLVAKPLDQGVFASFDTVEPDAALLDEVVI